MTGFLQRWGEDKPSSEVGGEKAKREDRSPPAPGKPGNSSLAATSPGSALPDGCAAGSRVSRMPVLDGNTELCGSESTVAEALREVADLLAIAYRRSAAIERVGQDPSPNSGNDELANSSCSSVHGVVP
jgi:hypothetical protein